MEIIRHENKALELLRQGMRLTRGRKAGRENLVEDVDSTLEPESLPVEKNDQDETPPAEDHPHDRTDDVLDKDNIIKSVTQYAETQLKVSKTDRQRHPIIQLVHVPARMIHLFSDSLARIRRNFSIEQLAFPALIIIAVMLIIKPLIREPAEKTQEIDWSTTLPAQLGDYSEALLKTVQTEHAFPIAQTEIVSTASAAFRLGQILADVELALISDNTKRLSLLLNRADTAAHKLSIPSFSAQVELNQDTNALTMIASEELKNNAELNLLYSLGYWLETTRFSLNLIEQQGESDALARQFQSIANALNYIDKAVRKYPQPYEEFSTLFSPPLIDLTHPEGRAAFSLQLDKTIAAFRNG